TNARHAIHIFKQFPGLESRSRRVGGNWLTRSCPLHAESPEPPDTRFSIWSNSAGDFSICSCEQKVVRRESVIRRRFVPDSFRRLIRARTAQGPTQISGRCLHARPNRLYVQSGGAADG